MSLERKIARGKIRAAWKNKKVPFTTLWARHQIKKYGYKKARVLNFIGKGLATLECKSRTP